MKAYLIPSTQVESFGTGFLIMNNVSGKGGPGSGEGPGSGSLAAPRHDDYRPIH